MSFHHHCNGRPGFSMISVSAIIKACLKNIKNKTSFHSQLFRTCSQMKDLLSFQWGIWGPNVKLISITISNSNHISLFATVKIGQPVKECLE